MSGYRRILRIFSRTARDRAREVEEEIRTHLEMRVAELKAKGFSETEAHRLALERFGKLEDARRGLETASRRRDRRLGRLERMDRVRRDVKLAFRRMSSAPGHTGLSVVIFALGIGLTTVMFTVADNVLLRPLPFPDSDRLVALWSVQESGEAFQLVSMGNWFDWREENRSLEGTGLHTFRKRITVSTEEDAFTAPGVRVSGAFFEVIRPAMAHGRAFTEDEAQRGADVVVVSEGFWRRVLGASPELGDRAVVLNGEEMRVIGVIASGQEHPQGIDLWTPEPYRAWTGRARNNINYLAVARLSDGVTRERAEADLSGVADGIRMSDPEGIYSYGVSVRPLHEAIVGEASGYLGVLMSSVVLVLLIVCTNLAALGFARGSERTGEIAVRLSLGASRQRLIQQLVTEQMVLALIGGALGVLVAWWGTGAIGEWIGSVVPRAHEVVFDARIAAFGFGISVLAGTLAGIAPAWRVAGGGPAPAFSGARTVRGRGGLTGALLVGGEVALTVLLLTGGGLLLMSFAAVVSRDLGFDPNDVVTAEISLTSPDYLTAPERAASYWTTLLDETSRIPGVVAAGVGNWIPTGGGGSTFVELPDDDDPGSGAGYRVVSDRYFDALRIPVVQGRGFRQADQHGTERVVVINRSMAERFWPSSDPVGQLVKAPSMEEYWYGGQAPWLTVIGVVGDVRHGGFESDPRPEMFVLYRQMPWMSYAMTALVRMRDGESTGAMIEVRSRARAIDPSLAVNVSLLERRVDRTLSERRMILFVLTTFAAIALLLASLGVYGVISLAVARRTQEMAIRAALGAQRRGLVGLVMGGALRIVLAGSLVGILLAIALRRTLDMLLVDVSSSDPLAYVAAGIVLSLTAMAAALLPARRAARMDPLEALRE